MIPSFSPLFALVAACALGQQNPPSGYDAYVFRKYEDQTGKPAFKGVEIYSWQEDGTWVFALATGTNYVKNENDVLTSCTAIRGLEKLKLYFSKLTNGETVSWVTIGPKMILPPSAITSEIEQLAKSKNIRLFFSKRAS